MLIRSQDNKILTDDLNIRIDKHYVGLDRSLGAVHKGYEIRNKIGILGIYETEEKAIKVLDMLENNYNLNGKLQFLSDGTITTTICNLFQFPAEEELED